jgi:hypothetical protein
MIIMKLKGKDSDAFILGHPSFKDQPGPESC